MTEREIEITTLQAALIAANGKVFEAGKLAGRQHALIDELLAALQGLVEHGTDSPQHQAAEAAIRRAREWMDSGR